MYIAAELSSLPTQLGAQLEPLNKLKRTVKKTMTNLNVLLNQRDMFNDVEITQDDIKSELIDIQLLKIQQVADLLGVCRETVDKWVHRKYNPLPTFSVVGMQGKRITVGALKKWINEQQEGAYDARR